MKAFYLLLLALLGFVLVDAAAPAFAQTSNAEISGLITDASGAAVPGAKITIVNTATNVTTETESNPAGVYVAAQLIPGPYKVTITRDGFKGAEQTNVVLRTGDRLSLNFALEVGALTQQVTITAEAPLLALSDARNANVVDNKMINNLPQLNRNTLDYMSMNPSVLGSGPYMVSGNRDYNVGLRGATYTVATGQPNGTSVSIDGANMNEGDSNVLNRAIPSPDAIGELRVQTGVLTADQGRYSGGVVTASTLSGANAFHGKLFEYFRNQDLNANSWSNNNHFIAKDVRHQNNFGGAVGGPVLIPKLYNGHDRTFFFVAYEAQRYKYGRTAQSSVPTAAEREGDFSGTIAYYDSKTNLPVPMRIFDPYNGYNGPNGTWVRPEFPNAKIPKAQMSKAGYNLLNLYPMPNHDPVFNTSSQNNYWSPVNSALPVDRLTVRLDENINANHRVNVRVSRYNASNITDAPFPSGVGAFDTDLNWSGSLQYYWSISPSSVFEARAGYSYAMLITQNGRDNPKVDTDNMGFDPMIFSTGNRVSTHVPPASVLSAYDKLGGNYLDAMPSSNFNTTLAYTKILGRHTIKAGFEYYHTAMHEYGGDTSGADRFYGDSGTSQFWNAANNTGFDAAALLLGAASMATYGSFNYSPYMASFGAYVMDDWKVNNKLTVQVGLRMDHDGPKKMKYANTGVVWDFNAKNVLTPNANWNWAKVQAVNPALANLGQPAWLTNGVTGRVGLLDTPEYPGDELFSVNAAVWQPRLGISYAPNPKTVVRVSGGIIYQGLYGLGMNYLGNIYYGKDIFNQVLTQDGKHYISEIGLEHGLGTFPLQPDGSRLGYVPAIKTNKDYWNATYGQIPSPAAGVSNLLGPHQDSPQEYAWGLTVQREVGKSWVATAEYSGLRGIHMVQPLGTDFTNVPVQYYSLGSHLYDTVPNPFYGQSSPFAGQQTIQLWHLLGGMPQYSAAGLGQATLGYMKAHYLNLQMQTRGYHGLMLQASYAIRKTLTTSGAKDNRNGGSAMSGMQDPNNLNEAYGVATYEIPQKLSLNYSYDLPVGRGRRFLGSQSSLAGKILDNVVGGWAVAGITTYYPHGTPVAAPGVPKKNGAPNEAVRYSVSGKYKAANFDSSCALLRDNKFVSSSPCRYFDPSVFVRTPDYTFGNLPKYFPDVRNPGGFTTDATMMKNFYFSGNETRYLNLRAEAMNIFNHPNYGSLVANPNSVAFGGLNGKSGNRTMQIGLRIFF